VCADSQSEILQKLDDVGSVLREGREQCRYGEALKNTCFLDSYREDKLALILNLDTFLEGNDVWRSGLDGKTRTANNFTVSIFHHNSPDASVWLQSEQKQMLVRNIEIVKGVDHAVVPSFVRLNIGNDSLEESWASGVYFNPMKGGFQLFPSIPNREFGELGTGSGDVSFDGAHPCVIERGMKIMKGISSDQRQTQQRFLDLRDVILDASKIAKLRSQGHGWKKISRELGVGVSTVLRIAHEARETGSENPKPQTSRTPARKIRIDSASGSAVAQAFR
jgi:hypothetical protein